MSKINNLKWVLSFIMWCGSERGTGGRKGKGSMTEEGLLNFTNLENERVMGS